MFSPFKKLSFTSSHRTMGAVIGLSLAAVATAVYLSPVGQRAVGETPAAVSAKAAPVEDLATKNAREAAAKAAAMAKFKADAHPAGTATPAATAKPTSSPTATATAAASSSAASKGSGTKTVVDVVKILSTPTKTATAAAGVAHCSSFTWQQDAQAAYVANLSDPGALDGAAGPNNGDGLACNQLPVDPSRAPSTPVNAYVPPTPTTATKAALAVPASKYFGVAQDGLPRDSAMFDSVDTLAGKAPSSVSWFTGFDSDYAGDSVTAAWNRGALPVITWMSVAMNAQSGHDSSEYTLTKIASGAVDPYLTKYAGDIVRTNLPVVIRFDHEMNGNTYPWSAGMYKNTPALYRAAWQHVWNIFQAVGANSNVIWLWAPTRIDLLKPHATSGGGVGQTDLAEDYPGDQYVDWVGASVYLRLAATGDSYSGTFGKTIAALEALTTKPVFIPETGAIQTDATNGADVSALKASWIANAFAGFLADPRIVGFTWFNNVGTTKNGAASVTNDWRFNSSPASLSAFQAGLANSKFLSGTMPDGGV